MPVSLPLACYVRGKAHCLHTPSHSPAQALHVSLAQPSRSSAFLSLYPPVPPKYISFTYTVLCARGQLQDSRQDTPWQAGTASPSLGRQGSCLCISAQCLTRVWYTVTRSLWLQKWKHCWLHSEINIIYLYGKSLPRGYPRRLPFGVCMQTVDVFRVLCARPLMLWSTCWVLIMCCPQGIQCSLSDFFITFLPLPGRRRDLFQDHNLGLSLGFQNSFTCPLLHH